MKKVVIAVIVVAVVLGAALIGRGRRRLPVEYKLAPAKYASIVDLVSETGNLMPAAAFKVFSGISGRVTDVYVENSESVDAGDRLFYVVNDLTGQERTIEAPAGGRVVNLSTAVGERVSAPGVGGADQAAVAPVLVVADLDKYTIELMVNEVDIDKIKVGQQATVMFDAVPDKTFKAKVGRVDTLGTNTQGVITYNVYLELEKPTDELRPTMTANVDIQVEKKKRVLTVPNGAVKPYKGGKAVRVLSKKTKAVHYVPVDIGIVGPLRTEIAGGVTEGRQVIIGRTSSPARRSPFGPPGGPGGG